MANPDEEIRCSLSYDPDTGDLRWLRSVHNRKRARGEVAGFCRTFQTLIRVSFRSQAGVGELSFQRERKERNVSSI
jgi:hypothetical protein